MQTLTAQGPGTATNGTQNGTSSSTNGQLPNGTQSGASNGTSHGNKTAPVFLNHTVNPQLVSYSP